MVPHIVNLGSVEDIRVTLQLTNEISPQRLRNEIAYEKNNKNRATVIKMLESKLRKMTKDEKNGL